LRSLLAIGFGIACVPAHAQVAVNKSFNPISTSATQVATLTVQLFNSGASPATGTSLTDTLPAGLVIATPPNATTDCGAGTTTATAGGPSVTLTGGTIPAATGSGPGSCTLSVDVVAASAGSYINTIPANAVTSSQGTNPQSAQATLAVVALSPVAGSKAFSPANLHGGGVSTLTITLPNSNSVDLTNVALSDALPAQVMVATPSNLSTTCSPGTPSGSPGATSVGLSGATIPASGSCTLSVDVTPVNANAFLNATVTNTVPAGDLTSDQNVSNSVFVAPLLVQTGAQLVKTFAANPVANGASSTFTITVRNFNATALTPVTFTDNVPAGITPTNVADTCGPGETTSFTATSVTLTNGTVPPAPAGAGATTCTVTVTYTATNAGATPVTVTNTIPAGTFGTVSHNSPSANLTINPTAIVLVTKAFTGVPVQTGVLTLTITLNNASATVATITGFTDDLASMGAGFTIAASPAASTTCGGTVAATPGTTVISAGGGGLGTIPANGSCTVTVPVAIAGDATAGSHTNTILTGAVATDQGSNLVPVTATTVVRTALAISKSFSPTAIGAGQSSLLTITITRTAGAAALTGLALTDTLPTSPFAATIAASPAPTTTCGGTLTATAGTNVVGLTGGSLAGGAAATTCTISVGVTAPPGSDGADINTIAAGVLTTTELASNPTAAVATLTASNASVSLGKGFNPISVGLGGTTTLSLQVLNDSPNALTLTNAGLIDNLPAGMLIASPANPTFTGAGCTGGTLTATPGASVFQLAAATINANAICTLTVSVVANAAGNLINTIPANTVTSDQALTNAGTVSATVSASGSADLSITKDDGVTQATPGGSVVYQIVVGNSGPDDVDGASVVDNPPAGVTFTSWTCTQGAGAVCPAASGSGPINGLVSIPNGSNVTFQVTAAIASSATGSITNTATVAAPGTLVDTDPTNNSATDTDTLIASVDLAVTKTGPATVTAGQPISYAVVVQNNGPSDANGAVFSDPVPASVTGVTATCGGETGGAVCGSVSSGNNVASTITTFPVGASVTFTISGTAPTVAPATLVNTATIAPVAGVTDSDPTNNSSTVTTTVTAVPPTQADVAVTKAGPATVIAGHDIVYSISVTNNGLAQADGVLLADPAPAGLTFVSAGAPCAGGFPCSLGSMTSGQTIVITGVTFSTTTSLSGTIVNTATVSSTTPDPDLTNNTASVSTTAGATAAAPRVPVDARWALLLLTALLAWMGVRITRRR
jgi:uncharacterized repeat protein (TIGR01451 family)